MRILIVTPYYLPDGGPSAPLFAMLSEALVKRGHAVTVICAVPHYPSGLVLPEFRKKQKPVTENGVQVIRVRVPSMNRKNLVKRLIQFFIYQVGCCLAGAKCDYDVVLLSNPMLMVGLPFIFLSVARKKPAVYSIHDVYPDVGVTLGVFRNKPVIAAVAAIERFGLEHARRVRILSESFVPGLRNLGVPDGKMTLIYDWVDTDLIRPLPRQNSFAREHNLVDKFVVMYAGNLGLSQGLEHVLSAAEILCGQEDIRFVIVGDGIARPRLIERVNQRSLQNVQFIPAQPRARLPELLAAADVSLVTLQKGIGNGSLPSKSFSILASGRPLIASVDEKSDLATLIHRAQAGIYVPSDNSELLANAILEIKEDAVQRRDFGENGRSYVLKHHSPETAAAQFETLLTQALDRWDK
jgi:colanic acid biosynthesis glycosyl transferase WcaI